MHLQEWENPYLGGEIQLDWEAIWEEQGWPRSYDEFRPEVADGIRSIVYNTDEQPSVSNLESDGGIISMSQGTHSILFYNNDTEYIVFNDDPESGSVSVTTRTRTRVGFSEIHANERTVSQPDMLYGSYVESYVAEPTTEPVVLPVTMRPLVYTYAVRWEFAHGAQYIALARGAMAGMAENVYIHSGETGPEAATLFFDAQPGEWGVSAQVRSFGVPAFHPGEASGSQSAAESPVYSLQLEVRLTNGQFKTFEADITDQIEQQPRGGVITVTGLEITDEEGQSGGSGFDVDVDDWGDRHEIEIPL